MEVTPIGLAFALAIGACLVIQPRALVWVLSAAIPFSHTAMLIVGDNGISPFWVAAVVANLRLGYLILLHGRERFAHLRGLRFRGATASLILFGIYGTLVTALGPALFRGIEVISPRGGLDSQIDNFTPLTYTTSNLAQLAYLLVGIGLVLYFIVEPPRSRRVLEVAICIGFALTLFKHLLGDFWPQSWFDSNPSYTYHWIIDSARERGPFAEPSLLGMFVAMSLAYLVSAFIGATWRARLLYGGLIVVGLYLYLISYTGTALVTLGIIAASGVVVLGVSVVRRASKRTQLITGGVAALVLLLVIAFWDIVYRYTLGLALEKLGTDSFANRNASNENSLKVMLESFGIGVGLGSDRPSSLFFLLLSCTGIIGTLLLLRAVTGFTLVGMRNRAAMPIAWALLAQVIAQLIAKPDLSMPATWFLLACLAATYDRWARTQSESSSGLIAAGLTSVATWIPREARAASFSLPDDTGAVPAAPHLVRRRARQDTKHRTRTKVLALLGLVAAVGFFGVVGYGGYVARAESASVIDATRSDIVAQVEKYEKSWNALAKRQKTADQQVALLQEIAAVVPPAFTTAPAELTALQTATASLHTTITDTRSGRTTPDRVSELAAYTPLGAGHDVRSQKKAIQAYRDRITQIETLVADVEDAREEIDLEFGHARSALAGLVTGVLASATELDLSDIQEEAANSFVVAAESLRGLPATASLDEVRDALLALVAARHALADAVIVTPPPRRDPDPEPTITPDPTPEPTDPPTPEPTPTDPTTPTPTPTDPTPTPEPTFTPDPTPTPDPTIIDFPDL